MAIKLSENSLYWTQNRELYVSGKTRIITIYAGCGDLSWPPNGEESKKSLKFSVWRYPRVLGLSVDGLCATTEFAVNVLQLRVVCHYFSQTQCKFCPRIVLSKKKALISEGLFLRRTA